MRPKASQPEPVSPKPASPKPASPKLATPKQEELARQLAQNVGEAKKKQQSIREAARKDKEDLQEQIVALQSGIREVENDEAVALEHVEQERLENEVKIRREFES